MSRAFVKDDALSEQVIVPPRALLPQDTPNYVTPRGLALLEAEREELLAVRAQLESQVGPEAGRSRQLALLGERLDALQERLRSALVVAPERTPGEVAFGATVRLRVLEGLSAGEEQRLTIVGVDEAELAEERVAFVAPIARALLGRSVGDEVRFRAARSEQLLKIVAVAYDPA